MKRRHHDVGGVRLPDATIDRSESVDAPWQVAFTATLWALIGKENRVMRLDEMRRGVEDLSAERYDAMPYYDRQTLAVASAMVERRYLTWDELNSRIEKLKPLHATEQTEKLHEPAPARFGRHKGHAPPRRRKDQ